MQFALVNGIKSAATPGSKAVCSHCGGAVQAKCGSKVVWHWAHLALENCDSWYEPETQWHRNWKNYFGKESSEITIIKGDKKHIADVLTKKELVIEFQNSPISSETIMQRENFYGKMIWVLNGESFKDKFRTWDKDYYQNWETGMELVYDFYHPIARKKVKALIVYGNRIKKQELRKILVDQKFAYIAKSDIFCYDLSAHDTHLAVKSKVHAALFKIFRAQLVPRKFKPVTYEWSIPRKSWTDAKAPVFIDFNEDYLVWIKTNIGEKGGEGLKVLKKDFLEKYV